MGNTEGGTPAQQILELVKREPGKYRQAHLVKMVGVSRQRVSQIVAELGLKDKLKQAENVPSVVKAEAVEMKTRVFEFYNGKHTNLNGLAQSMGLSVSQVYRVRQGSHRISVKFIIGALKAFPGYKFDDLFYIDFGENKND
ncbi:hypothetical protein ES703_15859 [subsurface metagenome]